MAPSTPVNEAFVPLSTDFDRYDVMGECKVLMKRMQHIIKTTPDLDRDAVYRWRWDICEFIEESLLQLHRIWNANKEGSKDLVILDEIRATLDSVKLGLGLPQGFRQCLEDMIKHQSSWREEFYQEFGSLLDDTRQTYDALNQVVETSKDGWFDFRVSARDIELLIRRHSHLHLKAGKLRRQLELCHRALRQSGVAHGRRTLAERSVQDKLSSTVASLAAAAVMPLPGAMEAWAVSTGMLWLSADAAWRHVVYEHPEDTTLEQIADQFDLPENSKALEQLRNWVKGDGDAKTGKVLIHNAAVRKLNVTVTLFSCIDGKQENEQNKNVFKTALENHPLGKVAKQVFKPGEKEKEPIQEGVVKITVEPARATILNLPKLHDFNWAWHATFSYGDELGDDSKVGECKLRDGLLVSFVSVDCGVRIHDGAAEVISPDAAVVPPEKGSRATAVGFVNRCFDTVTVKIFDGSDKNLIRHPVVEHEVKPKESLLCDAEAGLRIMEEKKKGSAKKDGAKEAATPAEEEVQVDAKEEEAGPKRWDIEIFFGGFPPRKTACEVTSCQIVYIDGVLEGGS
eukprot:gnl/MRDRNA2_/MRDRNA2_32346_c1_seq1.p1 gnl/MRDRNA2_/MRDRNA2_32346_c1~~gnl/MRDRNA2_/MRDRNA2_32346_c1_seq1.p1  ORF type:complete len:589 (+),score=133.03 gnl/MRDRNA2_/MRDRNA2_32346_c1_seq1:63-1769(+)